MANRKVTTAANLACEIEGDLYRIKVLNELCEWIGEARDYVDALEHWRQVDPVFKEKLRAASPSRPFWERGNGEGLRALQGAINTAVFDVQSACEAATEAEHE